MTSVVKVALTEDELDKLILEVKESVEFLNNFKCSDYERTDTVPTWFGLSSKQVKSYDIKRLRKVAPKYVVVQYYSFDYRLNQRVLLVELSETGVVIQTLVKMSLAGKDLYLTSEYAKVLNEVLGDK